MTGKNHHPYAALVVVFLTLFLFSCMTDPANPGAGKSDGPGVPGETETHKKLEELTRKGELSAALKVFESQSPGTPSPNGPESFHEKVLYGILLLGNAKTDEAERVFREAETLEKAGADPRDAAELHLGLAAVEGLRGREDRRRAELEKVLGFDTNNEFALNGLGDHYLARSDLDKAETYFRRALAVNPTSYDGLLGYGSVLARKDQPDPALSLLNSAVTAQPELSPALVQRAKVLESQGNSRAALRDMDKVISLQPDLAWHYLDRGRINLRAGRADDALADFNRVLELDAANLLAYRYRMEIQADKGRWDEAAQDGERALALRKDFRPVYETLATSYFIRGDFEKAADYFDRCFEPLRKNHYVQVLAALSLLETGDQKKLETYLDKVLPRFDREDPLYEVARYFREPGREGSTLNFIQNLKDEAKKAQAGFYVSFPLLKKGQKQTGVLFLSTMVDSSSAPGPETRIAAWKLHEYKQ